MTESAAHLRVMEETPAYWRVVFDYPPFNIVDAAIFEALQDLLARMDASPSLRVVVFESANPEFYLAHFDLTGKVGEHHDGSRAFRPPGPDGYVRASHQVLGGQHREDPRLCPGREQRVRPRLRHAFRVAREHAAGPARSRGRSASRRRRNGTTTTSGRPRRRALEIVLGANDFDGDTAERYGYVNRALPDAQLDGFVDALARRIASFDRRAIAAAKNLVNQVSLPSADRLLDAITSFETALTWPETQQRIQALLERGLQREVDFENRWPELLGTLLET